MTADDEALGQQVTFDEIGRMLLHYARSQGRSPRLALVLSGGGAKCSYQVGAVAAIEEKLAALHGANPDYPLDINLVVGTSGGAINALPIALGVTRSDEGRHQFADVWQSLDQRDIVRPARFVARTLASGSHFCRLRLCCGSYAGSYPTSLNADGGLEQSSRS